MSCRFACDLTRPQQSGTLFTYCMRFFRFMGKTGETRSKTVVPSRTEFHNLFNRPKTTPSGYACEIFCIHATTLASNFVHERRSFSSIDHHYHRYKSTRINIEARLNQIKMEVVREPVIDCDFLFASMRTCFSLKLDRLHWR